MVERPASPPGAMSAGPATTVRDILERARAHARAQEWEPAGQLCRALIALRPAHVGARRLLAGVLRGRGLSAEAAAELTLALAVVPGDADLQRDLGVTLLALGRSDEAVTAFGRTLERLPEDRVALAAIGRTLHDLGRHDEAAAALQRLVALVPDDPVALTDLGNALQEAGRFDAAIAAFSAASARHPAIAEVHFDLGNALMAAGRGAEAALSFDRALALAPQRQSWRLHRGQVRLGLGRLEEGWDDLEAHWRTVRPPAPLVPEWDGGAVDGRLLIWSDQALGVELLACGLLEAAAARAGSAVVECDPRMVPLLRRSVPGITAVSRGPAPSARAAATAHVPMTGLPRLLRRSAGSFPAHRGYLRADPARTAALRARYRAAGDGPLVGLSWRSANPIVGARKSLGLPAWAPILANPSATFVSLQYGADAAEAASAGPAVLHDPEINALADLDGFAAQVAAMDLVVTISNSTAHFAGALGKPCWLLLPAGNALLWCWYLCHGDRCPWYPSIRVFPWERDGGWTGTVMRAAEALRQHLAGSSGAAELLSNDAAQL